MRDVRSPWDDAPPSPDWKAFRRLMTAMAAIAVVTVITALAILDYQGVAMRLSLIVAVSVGITASLLLGGALMGLVFVSARSGHDATIVPPRDKGRPWRRP